MAIGDNFNPIKIPFAANGAKTEIPNTSGDSVNWNDGFGPLYARSIANNGKLVTRKEMNGILNVLSKAIQYFQKGGVAVFNSTFASDGNNYKAGSVVWYKSSTDGLVMCEAIVDTTKNPINDASGAWKKYSLFSNVGGKFTAPNVNTGTLKVGAGITITDETASGCPTPRNATDFVNKSYVDESVSTRFAVPNYSAGQTIQSGFTAPSNGIVILRGAYESGGDITISGRIVTSWRRVHGDGSSDIPMQFIVGRGNTISFTGNYTQATFYPCL